MKKVGRKGIKKDAKPLGKKVWDAIRGGEVEVAVGGAKIGIKAPPPKEEVEIKAKIGEAELEARAPSVDEAKQLLDDGAEAVLKIVSQTRDILREAKVEELESRQIREEKIKSKKDSIAFRRKAAVKALPKEQKQRFNIFTSISLGDAKFHRGAFIEAEKAYRDAYKFAEKLNDKSLQAICLNLIGAAIGSQGKLEEALTLFNEAIKLKPDYAGACCNKGVALSRLGLFKEALVCFDEEIRLKPDYAGAWFNKGVALDELGQHKEAQACLDEAIKLKPDYANAWCEKGVSLIKLKRDKEALACYDEAIKLEPDYAEAWDGKGAALTDLGQLKEALACYDEAIKLKPDYAEAWYNKGVALGKLGQHKEVLACCDEAIRLKPDLAEAWNNKGAALDKLGQPEEALAYFDEAIKVKPDFSRAWYNKGLALGKLGLEGIKSGDMNEVEERALELIKLKNGAGKGGMAQAVDEAMREFKQGLSKKELESFKVFEEIFKRFEAEKQ